MRILAHAWVSVYRAPRLHGVRWQVLWQATGNCPIAAIENRTGRGWPDGHGNADRIQPGTPLCNSGDVSGTAIQGRPSES